MEKLKSRISKMSFLFGTIVVFLTLQFCSRNEFMEDQESFPDKVTISTTHYNEFVIHYNDFFNAIPDDKKELLDKFIKEKYIVNAKSNNAGRTNLKVTCNCVGGNSCSAETWASDCCICCHPPKSAACGTYWGIASCKCEELSESRIDVNEYGDEATVNIYPNRFFEIFAFADKNSINTISIRNQLLLTLKKS